MGQPQPYDPEQKPDPKAPRPAFRKADWVVGAEEGLSAEAPQPGETRLTEAPRLVRPEDPDAGKPREPGRFGTSGVFRRPVPTGTPGPVPTTTPTMPSWEKGTSSVPKLRPTATDGPPAPHAPVGEPTREFPMDDAEERARVAAAVAQQHREEAENAARPHQVVAPQEFDIPTLAPPWWTTLAEQLRSDRRVQAALGAALLAVLVLTFWPRNDRITSIAHLKQHAERFADTPVRVGGRVSEVFSVGSSWAYTVVQGRDTIVVFSRTRAPKVRERIVVVGTLSRGFLDGQSRVAIFESTR